MSELKRELQDNPDDDSDDGLNSSNHGSNRDGVEAPSAFTSVAPNADLDATTDSPPTRRSRFGRRKKDRSKKKRRLTLAVLPTLLTLGNGVCGLAAIAVAMSVDLDWTLETKLMVAGCLIFGGMLFDAFDGAAARMTGQTSQFGAELDSLCDAVTFGTAPAVIIWRIGDGLGVNQLLPQKVSWAIGVLFALCVLIRLARFNVETEEDDPHEGFEGLPSPAAAGTLAAFAIALPELNTYTVDLGPGHPFFAAAQLFIAGLALVLAYLMVSRFQYPHVFQQLVRGRRDLHQIGLAMFIVIGAVTLHWLVFPIACCYYAFASPVRTLIKRFQHRHDVDVSSDLGEL